MGLLKGGFSFARFHMDGKLPQDFLNFINKQIKANSYRETQKSTQEKQMGWVSLTDVLDAAFEQANYVLADYLVFCLRIDRKLISPKLLKLKLMEKEKRYLAESGKNRINKQTAAGIKEKVSLELIQRQDAVPSFYDVCWSLKQNTIYFSSLADKVADDFVELFKKTFLLNLRRFLPQENLPPAKNNESAEGVSLIGREFLTWLWFKSEERNGRITLNNGDEVELHLLKRIALEAGEGEYAQGVVCSGIHAELKEGKEAIRQGKKVKEAGIKLAYNQNEWEFMFKADTFDFQSLKLPVIDMPEVPEDQSGNLLERIYLIENAVKIMDNLFESFLHVRFLPEWKENEMKLLTKWLEH
jgi:hypothetical protein